MTSEYAEGAVCRPNIGPRERAKRRRLGWVFGVVSVVTGVALIGLHAPRFARAAVFVPAMIAAYGYFQAREKT